MVTPRITKSQDNIHLKVVVVKSYTEIIVDGFGITLYNNKPDMSIVLWFTVLVLAKISYTTLACTSYPQIWWIIATFESVFLFYYS